MSRHKVEIVNVNTANIKVLSSNEQDMLFKRLKSGEDVKGELINGNLKLVLSILKKYNGRCENMDDLFQVGCIGLIKAIDNFDLNYNVKFSTYAVPMILGEIKRYLRDNTSIRIARSVKDLSYRVIKVREELTNKNGKEPNTHEIANKLDISEYDVVNAINSMKEPVSMYEPIYNDGGDIIYLEDQLNSDEGCYDVETKIALKKALDKLKFKERHILTQRYFVGKTQIELASELGISQAQISRLEKSGLENIKKMIS